jgi:hypothetical protein
MWPTWTFNWRSRPKKWTCAVCGGTHDVLPAVAFSSPCYYDWATDGEKQRDFELTSDTCVWRDEDQEHFFVRCVLDVPILGADDVLSFGVWSSLSADSFERYLAGWDDPFRSQSGTMFGWLSNRIPEYPDTVALSCDVVPRDNGLRPQLFLTDEANGFAKLQRQGIARDDAMEYVHRVFDF